MGVGEKQAEDIVENGGKILSAAVSQTAILNGLEHSGISFDTINVYQVPPYPRYKLKQIPRYTWSHNNRSVDIGIGYTNLKYISHLSKTKAIKREAKAWAKKHKNEKTTIFVYSMHSPLIAGAIKVKKILPEATVVLIVPDLPQFMDLGMSKFKKLLKFFDWQKLKRQIRNVDKYVLYSKHMAEFLNLEEDRCMVMEGSFDLSSVVHEESKVASNKISVMYSGVVDMRYGIPELLKAMDYLDDEYELWITGGGNAVAFIEEKAKNDERIKYFGFLPSRKELLLKQKSATMLISTRRPCEEASKYCFPSKLFEYMVSGNPVLSCRIGGIPDEYFDFLTEIQDITPQYIADAIKKVSSLSEQERDYLGQEGKKYVLEKKNNIYQAKRIMRFLEGA